MKFWKRSDRNFELVAYRPNFKTEKDDSLTLHWELIVQGKMEYLNSTEIYIL